MRQRKHCTFDLWWAAVLEAAKANDFTIRDEAKEDFRAYYDSGMMPLDALIESRFG